MPFSREVESVEVEAEVGRRRVGRKRCDGLLDGGGPLRAESIDYKSEWETFDERCGRKRKVPRSLNYS
jgi:hypothetical protein